MSDMYIHIKHSTYLLSYLFMDIGKSGISFPYMSLIFRNYIVLASVCIQLKSASKIHRMRTVADWNVESHKWPRNALLSNYITADIAISLFLVRRSVCRCDNETTIISVRRNDRESSPVNITHYRTRWFNTQFS